MRPYLSRVRKALVYFAVPVILASCAPARENQNKSFLDKAKAEIAKIKSDIRYALEAGPPNIEGLPLYFNECYSKTSQKELRRPTNYRGLLGLKELELGESYFDLENPIHVCAMDFQEEICGKALKKSLENLARDHFLNDVSKSSLDEDSDFQKNDFDTSLKGGFYHGMPYVGVLLEGENLTFLGHQLFDSKFELGTRGIKLGLERTFGNNELDVEITLRESETKFSFGLREYKINKDSISILSLSLLHEIEDSSKETVVDLGYLVRFR